MRWYRLALALVAVLTAAATLAFGAVAGLSYLWCAPMGEARLHCCCPIDEDSEARDLVRPLCCEARVVADLPFGLVDRHAQPMPPNALAGLAAPPRASDRAPSTVVAEVVPLPRPLVRARGRPARRLHEDCSVYLL